MAETLLHLVKKASERHIDSVIRDRRHLHMHPELSFEEEATGKYIQSRLQSLGIRYSTGWAEHGVVAEIQGGKPGKQMIALRADMDALPIQEENQVPYCSVNPGVMHACGHDVHTASLLGAAALLQDIRDHFAGTIRLIFQPAEEKLPGGASLLIKQGVLANPVPEGILGQHVHPPLEAGTVGFREGMFMASCDEIYITLKGKGGHGALPHECIDPIMMAAAVLTGLQQVVSRKSDPLVPNVLTFGKIQSKGGANNVIPNEVRLEGTFRTMNEEWRRDAHQWIRTTVNHICASMGGTCDIDIEVGYPFLVNDLALTRSSRQYAAEYLGTENVIPLEPRMTAEDFSYYSQEIPACFYRLGTGNKTKKITSPVHTTTFDIDERAFEISSGLMVFLALRRLGNQ
ncbi:MAG: amidohydrolase [Saprospiraceae bacterium]|nr:amidohydrolase [Saprospiraceae bacterium]